MATTTTIRPLTSADWSHLASLAYDRWQLARARFQASLGTPAAQPWFDLMEASTEAQICSSCFSWQLLGLHPFPERPSRSSRDDRAEAS